MKAMLQSALAEVVEDVVRPAATDVDATGRFPRAGVDALAEAGLLGLPIAESHGGLGLGLGDAVEVIRTVGSACGSTAMVVLMHYTGAIVLENYGSDETRRAIAAGRHLTTLALSEVGSRSEFWVPMSTAARADGTVYLNARKSWITSAGEADSYVWSSRPVAADGAMTLWLVPSGTGGLSAPGAFNGLGLRGNRSAPMAATDVGIDPTALLGRDGDGMSIVHTVILPWFLVLNAAFCIGLMNAVIEETGTHLVNTRFDHLGHSLAEVQLTRIDHARMRITADQAGALLGQTVDALSERSDDAVLRMLEVKAAAGEAAAQVSDMGMKVCGGAAFRHELSVERRFRDARAARVMAPTTDALLDFIGREINGLSWP